MFCQNKKNQILPETVLNSVSDCVEGNDAIVLTFCYGKNSFSVGLKLTGCIYCVD